MKIYLDWFNEEHVKKISDTLKLNFDENGLYFESSLMNELVRIGSKVIVAINSEDPKENKKFILSYIDGKAILIDTGNGSVFNRLECKYKHTKDGLFIAYNELRELVNEKYFTIIDGQ